MTYIENPHCLRVLNTEWTLFVLDARERTTTKVKAHFGQSAVKFVEVTMA